MEKVEIIRIDHSNIAQWNQSLQAFQYSLFLAPEWVDAVADENSTPIYLDFLVGDKVVAKLSGLVCKGSAVKGDQLYFYAAPAFIGDTLHLYNNCHDALRDWAARNRFSRVVLASYDQQNELVCNAKGYYTNLRYEYIVDFSKKEEIGKFSTGFKKNVKKAEKLGTTFHEDNTSASLDKLLLLLGVTRDIRVNKYGNRYNPFYLKNLDGDSLQKLVNSGIGKLYHTLTDNQVYSVQFNIEKGKKSYGLLMGSDGFAYKNGLPSFVDHHLIHNYNRDGFLYYNPGGGPVDEGGSGIEQYKKAMGASKFIFAGSTTNFLVYPQKLLNPLLLLGRRLPASDKGIVGFLKRFV
jgi:hypothetical protein